MPTSRRPRTTAARTSRRTRTSVANSRIWWCPSVDVLGPVQQLKDRRGGAPPRRRLAVVGSELQHVVGLVPNHGLVLVISWPREFEEDNWRRGAWTWGRGEDARGLICSWWKMTSSIRTWIQIRVDVRSVMVEALAARWTDGYCELWCNWCWSQPGEVGARSRMSKIEGRRFG